MGALEFCGRLKVFAGIMENNANRSYPNSHLQSSYYQDGMGIIIHQLFFELSFLIF